MVLWMSHLYFFYLSRFSRHVSVVLPHHRRQLDFHLGLLLAGCRLLLLVQLRRLSGLLCEALNALGQRSTLPDRKQTKQTMWLCVAACLMSNQTQSVDAYMLDARCSLCSLYAAPIITGVQEDQTDAENGPGCL